MRLRKAAGPLAAFLVLTSFASAIEAMPLVETVVQNLNGVQQCVRTYLVSPDFDAGTLDKEPFELDGYAYTVASVNRKENYVEDQKSCTETVTVKTSRQELSAVLAALDSTKEHDDGRYSGILTLNTSSIRTETAGYETSSYTVSATREFEGLDSNDLSYIPATTSKDGVTLSLQSVDWQVEGSELVEDMLVPSSYRAVASYSGTGYRKVPTGYISTASYSGTVSCRELRDVTYTVTFVGTALPGPDENGGTASDTTAEETAGTETLSANPGAADTAADTNASLADQSESGQPEEQDKENQSVSYILYVILGTIVIVLVVALVVYLVNRWRQNRGTDTDNDFQDQSSGDGDNPDGGFYYEDAPYYPENSYPDGGYPGNEDFSQGQGGSPAIGTEWYPEEGHSTGPDEGLPDYDASDPERYPEDNTYPEDTERSAGFSETDRDGQN